MRVTLWTTLALLALPLQAAEFDALTQMRQSSDDSSLRESALSSLSGVAFEAGEDAKQARLRWSKNTGTSAFGLSISVPVDEKEGKSSLADLDGLSKALTLAGNYTIYYTGGFKDPKASDEVCKRLELNVLTQCDTEHIEEKGTLADLREYAVLTVTDEWTPFLTFEAKAGRQKVDFFDTATLAKSEDTEVPYAISAGGGWLTLSSVIVLKAKLQRAVKENDKVTYCKPAEVDARVEDCATLAFGAPKLETSTVLSAEYRAFYGMFAISPTFSHDLDSGVSGLDLPIYFLKDGEGQFTGGVRLGYDTKDDDFTTSIFISKALAL